MQQYITDHSIANAIRMKRTQFVGAFLLVEGVADKHVYGLMVDRETCKIEIALGRDNLLGATRILNADSFDGLISIIDADFSHVTGEATGHPNILRTDFHDLDCMILNSPAFDRIIEEFGAEERIAAFAESNPLIARQLAMHAAPLGCLRLISLQRRLDLKFEGLRFLRFVDSKDLTIDVEKMIREVVNNSQKHSLDQAELAAGVGREEKHGHDCWQISCGHDIVEILSLALRKSLSGKNTGDVAPDVLERCLRLAYDAADLTNTHLYREVVDWETRNTGFQVLNSIRGVG